LVKIFVICKWGFLGLGSPDVEELVDLGSWHLIFGEEKVCKFKISMVIIGRVISGVGGRFDWRSVRRQVDTILVTRCSCVSLLSSLLHF
jgi:hypothetical protein